MDKYIHLIFIKDDSKKLAVFSQDTQVFTNIIVSGPCSHHATFQHLEDGPDEFAITDPFL
jgi:hypothetical protein